MGDGAQEITNAGEEVFGDVGVRLMCWPHVYRNLVKRMAALRNCNKLLQKNLMNDIEDLQWACTSEDTFVVVFNLLEEKYSQEDAHTAQELVLLQDFFAYFKEQWGPDSHVHRWYEGANPWSVSNNQGIEGVNKSIKKDHTFKRRCPLGTFMNIVSRMVKEWGEYDDSLLYCSRLGMLDKDRDGLKLKTQGYQWMVINKMGMSDRIVQVNPKGKYTISESDEFNLGPVDSMWVVASSSNTLQEKNLKKLAKQRIQKRGNPMNFKSFDEYMAIRQSCWILEQRDRDFYCDCPIGMKGKLCKHTVGMGYRQGFLEVTDQVRAVPLGTKRKRGRPKAQGHCLQKSPPVSRVREAEISTPPPVSSNACPSVVSHLVSYSPEIPPQEPELPVQEPEIPLQEPAKRKSQKKRKQPTPPSSPVAKRLRKRK